jgi:hypothetical protein
MSVIIEKITLKVKNPGQAFRAASFEFGYYLEFGYWDLGF